MWRVLILMAILCTAVGYLGQRHPLVTEQEQARLNCMADPTLMGCGDPDYK